MPRELSAPALFALPGAAFSAMAIRRVCVCVCVSVVPEARVGAVVAVAAAVVAGL